MYALLFPVAAQPSLTQPQKNRSTPTQCYQNAQQQQPLQHTHAHNNNYRLNNFKFTAHQIDRGGRLRQGQSRQRKRARAQLTSRVCELFRQSST